MADREPVDLEQARLKIHRFVKLEQMERLRDLAIRLADEVERQKDLRIEEGFKANEEVARLREDLAKWKRIRTPTHGSCCTCQACGEHHDDCRCDLDDLADDLSRRKDEIERLRAALKFYADPDNYGVAHSMVPEVNEDEGKIARAALKGK